MNKLKNLKVALGTSILFSTFLYQTKDEFNSVARHFSTLYTVSKIVKNYKQIDQFESKSACHQTSADLLLELFKKNGGVYVKIGQHMASLVHLIPLEYTNTMQVLQDACTPSSFKLLNKVFKEDYGKDINLVFNDFSTDPIGVASLAQVHKATFTHESNPIQVAVKIQHYYLNTQAEIDIKLCGLISKVIKKIFPDYEFDWLAEELKINLPLELDFENEHLNLSRCAKNFNGFKGIIIPKVFFSSPRILIMKFEEGVKINDLKKLKEFGVDVGKVGLLLSKIYNEMIFKHRFLHCDPHAGNLLVQKRNRKWYNLIDRRNFNIVVLDHGLYRELNKEFIKDYAKFWTSIINHDEKLINRYAYKIFTHNNKPLHGQILHHRLFASIISGRSWSAISNGRIDEKRRDEEVRNVQDKAKDKNFFEAITIVLSKCPRELLLVIKTNDLLRAINEDLGIQARDLKRIVLGMAWYCTKVYPFREYDEDRGDFWNFLKTIKLRAKLIMANIFLI
jgi:aarF domain-containing kinase